MFEDEKTDNSSNLKSKQVEAAEKPNKENELNVMVSALGQVNPIGADPTGIELQIQMRKKKREEERKKEEKKELAANIRALNILVFFIFILIIFSCNLGIWVAIGS
jgi:hypothetical protein